MLSVDAFAEKCLRYNKENNIVLDIKRPEECPVHIFAAQINKTTCKSVNPGIANCPVCSMPFCKICGSHLVQQISRVTGYMSDIGGWNSAKSQEIKDRRKYNIGVGTA